MRADVGTGNNQIKEPPKMLINDARTIDFTEWNKEEIEEDYLNDDASITSSASESEPSIDIPIIKPCSVVLKRLQITPEIIFKGESNLSDSDKENELLEEINIEVEVEKPSKKSHQSKAFKNHVNLRTNQNVKGKIRCEECGKFVTEHYYQRHVMLHEGVKFRTPKVRCYVCGNDIVKSFIEDHKNAHELTRAKKRLGCTICDFKTTLKCSVQRHFSKDHPGEKWKFVIVDE